MASRSEDHVEPLRDPQAVVLQDCPQLLVGCDLEALEVADTPAQELQVAPSHDGGVEELEAAGHRVAGVAERGLAGGLGIGDQLGEGVPTQDHLAADLDARRRRPVAGEAQGHRADRADVAGDVLALDAVAPRQGAHEGAVFVEQVGADAVELGLDGVGEGLVVLFQAEVLARPGVELADLVRAGQGLDRQHRREVLPLLHVTAAAQSGSDPLGGRVRGDPAGVLRLQALQLAKQLVVLGVVQVRLVAAVVLLVGPADAFAEFVDAVGAAHAGRCKPPGPKGHHSER